MTEEAMQKIKPKIMPSILILRINIYWGWINPRNQEYPFTIPSGAKINK